MLVVLAVGGSALGAEKKSKKAAEATETAKPAEAASAPAPEPTPVPTPDAVPANPMEGLTPEAANRPLLGDFSVGPILTIAAFPHPGMIGIESKYKNIAGLAINLGLFPEVTLSGVSAELSNWDVRARWFPFSRALFIGAALGNQTFDFSSTFSSGGQSTDINLEVSTTFLTPHIGWRWGAYEGTGFFTGMELGYQISMNNTTTGPVYSNPALVGAPGEAEKTADIRDMADDLGKASLPHFALIKFGWMF
jgi:hypothetical protein